MFNIGDMVRIKTLEDIRETYGSEEFQPGDWDRDMDEYCGEVGKIIDYSPFSGVFRVEFSSGRKFYYAQRSMMLAREAE